MKISIEEVSRLLASPTERSGGRASVVPTSVTNNGSAEELAATVQVSPTGQQVQQVKRMISQLPDVREDRVQALKAQVENGTYHVSGEDIADLIIRRALADSSAR